MSKINKNKSIRLLLVLLGSISVGMGVIGIFVPGWPTTIFLIIASYFYIRSSDKLYNWLLNNKILGIYLKNYYSLSYIFIIFFEYLLLIAYHALQPSYM